MVESQSQSPFIGITIEGVLRPCEIFPVQTATAYGYMWEWSAVDQDAASKHAFDLFFECLEDARRHGYEPHYLDRGDAAGLAVVTVAA